MKWIELVWIIVLGILSLEDIKTKSISLFPLLPLLPCVVWCLFHKEPIAWMSSICGMTVGVFFCVIGILSRERVGLGDGVIILLLGLYLGVYGIFRIVFLAFILFLIIAGSLCLFRKANIKTGMPFVPFLTVAYIANVCWFVGCR